LSAADVVRFKIENGKLTSTDGSVLRIFPTPSSMVNDVSRDDWASEAKPFSHSISVNSGYIVVYGMAQASNEQDDFDRFDVRYHHNHNDLFKNYRRELDVCRPGWRNGHQNSMVNGTYTRYTRASQSVENYSIAAPNQGVNCNLSSNTTLSPLVSDVIAKATNAARLASQITDKASAAAALDHIESALKPKVHDLVEAANDNEKKTKYIGFVRLNEIADNNIKIDSLSKSYVVIPGKFEPGVIAVSHDQFFDLYLRFSFLQDSKYL